MPAWNSEMLLNDEMERSCILWFGFLYTKNKLASTTIPIKPNGKYKNNKNNYVWDTQLWQSTEWWVNHV
jgi:hypothetical protein